MDRNLKDFMAAAKAAEMVNGVPHEEQSAYLRAMEQAVHICDAGNLSSPLSIVFAGLAKDRYWEPSIGDQGEGLDRIDKTWCQHTLKFYVGMALSMFGEREAMSINTQELFNAAWWHFLMDLRNATKPWLEKWGRLPGKEEDI